MKFLFAGAVSLATLFTIPTQAGQAQQVQNVDLGGLSGVAYYTTEAAGYRVIVSLARHDVTPAVRFEATLAPDQDAVVSIPRELGVQAQSLRIRRVGDAVIVRKIVQDTASAE
ncbi:UNVERIFIED_CONTAM: hypothetical protein Q9R58_25450 [Methylobacteriaceae bacterium AG10]|nr:hypothetical protein [Methylobacteriaceae bacterium AG10]